MAGTSEMIRESNNETRETGEMEEMEKITEADDSEME
jgi:hypothetical protein